MSHVIDSWYRSRSFVTLGTSTKSTYRGGAEALRNVHGQKQVAAMLRRHVMEIMAEHLDQPNAANFRLRILRLLLDHALDLELVTTNVARTVKNMTVSSEGYHTWSEDEIAAFYAEYKQGSTAHTAMTLMLYTGAGRTDAAMMGQGNIINGRLEYRRQKMKTRNGVLVSIPIHPVLMACLNALPPGQTTFLQTRNGTVRSAAGLGNNMREWCDAVGLSECSSHGLRKACARRLIEAGATPHEMMSVTGHKTLAEAQRYAETFDRSSAADRAMEKQAYS
jgi:integrase